MRGVYKRLTGLGDIKRTDTGARRGAGRGAQRRREGRARGGNISDRRRGTWSRLALAGFAVLDIEATKGSLTGIGIIKIEEELTNEQTVIME